MEQMSLFDDGTFEGIPGNFSFYSISELDKTKLNVNCAFQNNVSTFQKVDTDNGTAMAVKTTGTRASMVYVKIREALVAGNEYEFSYNAKWLGDSLEGINYGYAILPTIANWVITSNANLEDNILNYTKTPNAFDGDFTITFKPAKDYEECYFVLFIQSKEVHVDMLVDNVKFEQKVQVGEPIVENILNDDGTFEEYKVINPKIVSYSEELIYVEEGEGCLSVNRYVEGIVPRHARITVEFYDENGNKVTKRVREEIAIAFQHEIDHCNGIII